MATRTASTTWNGDLAKGSGTTSVGSGAFGPVGVSWPRRTEDPEGSTSPEELIAAAHASCYAMALSHELGGAGATDIQLEVSAAVTLELGAGGANITTSALTVRGTVAGVDAAAFQAAAEGAKAGCPVSKALAGIEITLDASLA
jgi:osmotically inducible protein OsmC